MSEIVSALVAFLAILNPFALCLYLEGVAGDLKMHQFVVVMLRASVLSLLVFWVFAFAGDDLIVNTLGIRFAAMRVFGGVIFLVVGYNYVVKGYRAAVMLRGSLDELPSAIALPYMIGAGTITQAVLVGKQLPRPSALLVLFSGVFISIVVVLLFKVFHDHMQGARERIFDRYINILARANGLLIGAVSTEMVVSCLRMLWEDG